MQNLNIDIAEHIVIVIRITYRSLSFQFYALIVASLFLESNYFSLQENELELK